MNIDTELSSFGIYSLIVPTVFPTGDTRCFLAEGDDGWVLIDAGVSTPEARKCWQSALREIGISFRKIKRIYLTHNHLDHSGLAGWLQQQSGAQVFMPSKDIPPLAKYLLPKNEQIEQLRTDMIPYGIDDELIKRLVEDVHAISSFLQPYAEITPIYEGDSFRFGDDMYVTYDIPGHSDGHVVFFGEKYQRLFSGDAILADRLPQISDWPYSYLQDTLTINLQSLRRISNLKPGLVLTSHGPNFIGVSERLKEIEKLHIRRMTKIQNILNRPMTLLELCRAIDVKARSLQEFRVSWADTRSYLEYMIKVGLVNKESEDTISYRLIR